jgi:hypothetical protein
MQTGLKLICKSIHCEPFLGLRLRTASTAMILPLRTGKSAADPFPVSPHSLPLPLGPIPTALMPEYLPTVY